MSDVALKWYAFKAIGWPVFNYHLWSDSRESVNRVARIRLIAGLYMAVFIANKHASRHPLWICIFQIDSDMVSMGIIIMRGKRPHNEIMNYSAVFIDIEIIIHTHTINI